MTRMIEGLAEPTTPGFFRVENTSARLLDTAGSRVPSVSTTADAVVFDIVRSRAGLEALSTEWTALFERCGRPHQVFQTFNWNWQWAQAFLSSTAQTSPIAILTGRSNGRLVTLWPMVLERRGPLVELSWMGEPVSQYGDVLLDNTVADPLSVLRAGWNHIVATLKPDLARLRKVRGDAVIAPLLDALGSLHTAKLEAPYIDLTKAANFAAYEERFPNRARRNRRRQMRRLEEIGSVTFEHLAEGAEASQFAETGIALKRQWLIDRGYVSPALADARMSRFMVAATAASTHSTAARVSVLHAGDQRAAIQIGFDCLKTRALHVIVYDRQFEKMAAGVLHLEEAIRHGFDEGLERIDLLAPAAAYKLDWADGTVAVVDHAIGLSTTGRAYARVYLGYLRNRLKAVVERLPHKVRQLLVTSHLRSAAKRIVSVFTLA